MERAKISVLINIIIVVIIPTLLGFSLLDTTLLTINNTILLILNGIIITVLAFFNAKLESFSKYKLIVLVFLQILIILQFIILIPSDVIFYSTPSISFYIDLRTPYLFLLGVPVLVTILNFYKFHIKRRDMKIKLIVLYTINSYNLSKKNINIRKYFNKYIDIDKDLKNVILKTFNSYLLELRKNSNNIIIQKRNNKLNLSEKGKKVIQKRDVNKMLRSIVLNYYSPIVEGYEVWNERELRIYNFKRKLSKLFIKKN